MNSRVAIRFHDHPTCPSPGPTGKYPRHACQGTYDPAYRETWVNDGRGDALTPFDAPSPTRQKHLIAQHGGVRGLSPIEWERLMGFPDNWTAMGTDGEISDTQRYKMCGNAVTTNVVQAVFERIFANG